MVVAASCMTIASVYVVCTLPVHIILERILSHLHQNATDVDNLHGLHYAKGYISCLLVVYDCTRV